MSIGLACPTMRLVMISITPSCVYTVSMCSNLPQGRGQQWSGGFAVV